MYIEQFKIEYKSNNNSPSKIIKTTYKYTKILHG